jgi:alpha-tubulin suppressor-like RCC1 family protein
VTQGHAAWCWGANEFGQLGDGGLLDANSRPQAPQPLTIGADFQEIGAGSAFSCGLRGTGSARSIWCWGKNDRGQLGQGSTRKYWVPDDGATVTDAGALWTELTVRGDAACALRSDGTAACWGSNSEGQLGAGVVGGTTSAPLPVVGASGAIASVFAVASTGACAGDGADLLCWGREELLVDGSEGNRDRAGAIAGFGAVRSVGVGDRHACAIKADGTLWCWGSGCSNGELGLGAVDTAQAPTQVGLDSDWTQVSAGDLHTCGIRGAGQLYCWGSNSNGRLGVGDLDPREVPTQVSGTGWLRVAAGGQVTCALRQESGGGRSLWCWGEGAFGTTGSCALPPNATDVTAPTQIGAEVDWDAVAVGGLTACGVRGSNLYCWGNNETAQVGDPGSPATSICTPTRIGAAGGWTRVAVGMWHGCAIRAGELYCWGGNPQGQAGAAELVLDRPTRVGAAADWTDLAAGAEVTCGRRSDGSLSCFGANQVGVLGNDLAWGESLQELALP